MKQNFEILPYEFKNEITIFPISDVHIGANDCMMKEFKKLVEYIASNENVYFTLGGDIIDNACLVGKNLGIFDNVKSPIKQIQEAVDILKPIKDKCLCIIPGNHEDRAEKVTSINPAYLIACELGIQDRYRSSLAILKITLGARKNNEGLGRHQTYTILVHHGKGTSESTIKKDHEFINNFEGCDIITTGHSHNGRVAKFTKYVVNKFSNIVTKKDITVIVSNSFLEDAEYGMKSMLCGASNEVISYDLKTGNKKKVLVHY